MEKTVNHATTGSNQTTITQHARDVHRADQAKTVSLASHVQLVGSPMWRALRATNATRVLNVRQMERCARRAILVTNQTQEGRAAIRARARPVAEACPRRLTRVVRR